MQPTIIEEKVDVSENRFGSIVCTWHLRTLDGELCEKINVMGHCHFKNTGVFTAPRFEDAQNLRLIQWQGGKHSGYMLIRLDNLAGGGCRPLYY